MKVNIYDFDKTIYDGDSGYDFYKYMIRRRPFLVFPNILKSIPTGIKILFKKGTTRDIKDKLFYFLKDVKDLDKYVKDFWDENEHKIKKWYIEQKEENDVIITANYEFLIREICNRLNIKNLIATEYDFKENKIKGIHSRGENKITLFKSLYPNYEVGKTYSDSMIDKPLLEIGNPGYLVKGNELIEYKK